MKKTILPIILVVAAAISLPAHAQFGGALKKAQEATKKVAAPAQPAQASPVAIPAQVQQAAPEQAEAEAPKVVRKAAHIWLLDEMDHTNDLRRTFAQEQLELHSADSAKVIKAMVEARHAENLTIMDELAKEEIKGYNSLMTYCQWWTTTFSQVKVENGKVVNYEINCGLWVAGFGEKSYGKLAFLVSDGPRNPPVVDPLPEEDLKAQVARYTNLATMMRKEPPAEQYPELEIAQATRSLLFMAQKNSLELIEKYPNPVPKDGMNDPALNAQLLKLAQAKFPDMGIVKVIVRDSEWTIERDALGNILRKRLGTFFIKKGSNGYRMADHSFAQAYEGSKYGATIHYAVGLKDVPVDYK